MSGVFLCFSCGVSVAFRGAFLSCWDALHHSKEGVKTAVGEAKGARTEGNSDGGGDEKGKAPEERQTRTLSIGSSPAE